MEVYNGSFIASENNIIMCKEHFKLAVKEYRSFLVSFASREKRKANSFFVTTLLK